VSTESVVYLDKFVLDILLQVETSNKGASKRIYQTDVSVTVATSK
jgi:hypothetical protein